MESRRKRLGMTLLAGLALLTTVSAASADIAVWLDPSDPTVAVGATTTVDIIATCDAPIMGWGIDLNIAEAGIAGWIGTTLGADWDAPGSSIDGDGLSGLRFPTGVSGDVVLATLTFEGLALGETTLTPGISGDEDEGFLLEAGGFDTNVTFAPATLVVVPEPATLVLLSIVSLVGIRRRR